jgi:hypothetical protein
LSDHRFGEKDFFCDIIGHLAHLLDDPLFEAEARIEQAQFAREQTQFRLRLSELAFAGVP